VILISINTSIESSKSRCIRRQNDTIQRDTKLFVAECRCSWQDVQAIHDHFWCCSFMFFLNEEKQSASAHQRWLVPPPFLDPIFLSWVSSPFWATVFTYKILGFSLPLSCVLEIWASMKPLKFSGFSHFLLPCVGPNAEIFRNMSSIREKQRQQEEGYLVLYNNYHQHLQ